MPFVAILAQLFVVRLDLDELAYGPAASASAAASSIDNTVKENVFKGIEAAGLGLVSLLAMPLRQARRASAKLHIRTAPCQDKPQGRGSDAGVVASQARAGRANRDRG